jgi:hypothetical protein
MCIVPNRWAINTSIQHTDRCLTELFDSSIARCKTMQYHIESQSHVVGVAFIDPV